MKLGEDATSGPDVTFAELFDRAATYDVDEAAIRRTLATRRSKEETDE
ncbi:hypothetical protein JCM18237_04500 [Halorubrum luteum]